MVRKDLLTEGINATSSQRHTKAEKRLKMRRGIISLRGWKPQFRKAMISLSEDRRPNAIREAKRMAMGMVKEKSGGSR